MYGEHKATSGSLRIYREPDTQGMGCSENRIARLVRLRGLKAKQSKRFKTTMRRNKKSSAASNMLRRDFETARPDQKWLADIKCIATGEGWLCPAIILDLHTQRIVGWTISDHMTSDLTLSALKMAVLQRQLDADLIHPLGPGWPVHCSGISGDIKGPQHPRMCKLR